MANVFLQISTRFKIGPTQTTEETYTGMYENEYNESIVALAYNIVFNRADQHPLEDLIEFNVKSYG